MVVSPCSYDGFKRENSLLDRNMRQWKLLLGKKIGIFRQGDAYETKYARN